MQRRNAAGDVPVAVVALPENVQGWLVKLGSGVLLRWLRRKHALLLVYLPLRELVGFACVLVGLEHFLRLLGDDVQVGAGRLLAPSHARIRPHGHPTSILEFGLFVSVFKVLEEVVDLLLSIGRRPSLVLIVGKV